jgi:type IV secretion system protein VirB10
MPEDMENQTPATIPPQPEPTGPIKKKLPVVIILTAVIGLIGLVNFLGFLSSGKKEAPKSALPQRPAAANPQQVRSFETLQDQQARQDAEDRARQQQTAAQMEALQSDVPGPEAPGAAPMTPAQRAAIYGNSSNAPQTTSTVSEAQAEAKQRELARQKQRQDALNSDTVAIDFAHTTTPAAAAPKGTVQPEDATGPEHGSTSEAAQGDDSAGKTSGDHAATEQRASDESAPRGSKTDPMAAYDFDEYQGRLYRVFEGTVLEGVVTNHVDGGLAGPVLVMLTTDYYSHDHQQLLMPQGTRLIGSVSSVSNGQQRKLFVTFHRAVCPDGFSLDFDKYLGLDQIGTTGLATKVSHGYLQAFGAAAAIGGLGGLAQIGNSTSVLDPSAQIRNGISSQTSQEAVQILNHFLNRLPVITLKEGSRARVYIGRDILIPSYADHRVDPNL